MFHFSARATSIDGRSAMMHSGHMTASVVPTSNNNCDMSLVYQPPPPALPVDTSQQQPLLPQGGRKASQSHKRMSKSSVGQGQGHRKSVLVTETIDECNGASGIIGGEQRC
jgi:hypothetical protein